MYKSEKIIYFWKLLRFTNWIKCRNIPGIMADLQSFFGKICMTTYTGFSDSGAAFQLEKLESFYNESIILPEKLFKVIIIGDPTVGKTSFVQRYVENAYKRDYKGTVGVDFALKILKWSETQTIKLQLWDIAGQERFTWMTRVYYKDAHGCVIMFDLTNKNSFVNTLKWKRDVDSKCSLPDGRPIPCLLLANKCDLSHRQVNEPEIEAFHKEHNFCGWTETSAKEGDMVNDSMSFLVDVMLHHETSSGDITYMKENLKLAGPVPKVKKTCSC